MQRVAWGLVLFRGPRLKITHPINLVEFLPMAVICLFYTQTVDQV